MDPSNTKKLIDAGVEEGLRTVAKDIVRKRAGLTDEFEVKLVTIEEYLEKKVDVAVVAGNPPIILVSSEFVVYCLYAKGGKIIIRDRLERAIEKCPKVTRSLHNLIRADVALELRRDAKQWVKTLIPNYIRYIPDRFFKVTYSVTVTEEHSGMSIELHGTDAKQLEREAKKRLTSSILANEEMEELFEMIRNQNNQTIKENPSMVTITTKEDGSVHTKLEY